MSRRGHNNYSIALQSIDASKHVWMAIAYALAARLAGGTAPPSPEQIILSEWETLHQNGIVPQKPRVRR